MFNKLAALVGLGLLPVLAPLSACADQQVNSRAVASCEALVRADFARVEDAPASLISVKVVQGDGDLPSYCEVVGYTWHDVQFRVRLPLIGWNGKLVVFGTGGQAGDFLPDDPVSPTSLSGSALRQGYAAATHNGGHVSSQTSAEWSYQNETALLDYGFRAPHVAGLIARAVVQQSYGRPPRLVYFSGCSNGGREALQMAQRYPYDYDGIIAGAPSMRWSELFINLYWFSNRLYGPHAVLDEEALQLIHATAVAQCSSGEGKRYGVIDDPLKCRVSLAEVACRPGVTSHCLTPPQAKAVEEIYDGPHNAAGRRLAFSSALPGSELTWNAFPGIEAYPPSVFRYQSFMPPAGPAFVPDESKLEDYVRRSGGSDAILSATNPDLRKFRDNGGKLLSYMGWADPVGGIRETLDYHATVERVMGGPTATQDFYRLFMVPGMNHCSGGEGATQIDWLLALDAWVDAHRPPVTVTGYHPNADGKPAFTRTLAPYASASDQ